MWWMRKKPLENLCEGCEGLLHVVRRDGFCSSWGQAITRVRLCRRFVCKAKPGF